MMKKIYILVACLVLSAFAFRPVAAQEQAKSYMDITIPTMEGATDIAVNRDLSTFQNSVTYKLQTSDLDTIYAFYNSYFTDAGYVSTNWLNENWKSRNAFITEDGPRMAVAANWSSKEIPVSVVVTVTATNYNNGLYHAEVTAAMGPNNLGDFFGGFGEDLLSEPEAIFTLYKAIGYDRESYMEIRSLDVIPDDMREEPIVAAYIDEVMKLKEAYEAFGAQYVYKTKPEDDRFKTDEWKSMVGIDEEDKADTSEESEDPLRRWRKLQEERMAEKGDSDKSAENNNTTAGVGEVECGVGNPDETEDPLHRWRKLQEERVARQNAEEVDFKKRIKELEAALAKYEYKTKPEDDRFKRHKESFCQDLVKLNECEEAKENGLDMAGCEAEKPSDPLYRWRKLQEDRIEANMKSEKLQMRVKELEAALTQCEKK